MRDLAGWLLIWLIILMNGCSSGGNEAYFDTWSGHIYLPYIESVELPETIHVGEEFVVRLHISSEANPDLLNGMPTNLQMLGASSDGYSGVALVPNACTQSETMISLSPWIANPPLIGVVNDAFEVSTALYSSEAPGQVKLRIYSAKTRDKGGIELHGRFNFSPPYHNDAEFQEYSITVLPTEEAQE